MDRVIDCSCSFTSQSITISCKLGLMSLISLTKKSEEFVHSKQRALYSDSYSELVTIAVTNSLYIHYSQLSELLTQEGFPLGFSFHRFLLMELKVSF